MAYVFVSYAREDQQFVTELHGKLRGAGIDVWQDTNDIRAGEKWAVELDDALAGAGLLVLVLSTASARSEYVTYEWAFASGARIPVVPVRISGETFHPRIEMTQILDFKTQRPWDRLTHEVLEKLDIKIATIRRLARSLLAPQRDERHAARTELSSFAQHPVARDEFVRATKSSWAEVRDWAVTMLIQQRDARVVPALIDKLREPYSWNRKATISDLDSVVDESSGPQLLALLASEDGRLADLAVHLLGRVGRSVAPRLLTMWRSNAPLKDRAAALRALGAVGARKLRDEASRLLIYSRKVELRMAAAEYLGRIADIKDAPTLMKVLKSRSASESVRGTAAVAIARMKHKAAIPVIVKLFHKRVAWTDMAEALLRFDTDETRSVVGEERTRATNIVEAGPDDKATELALASISRLYEEIENRAAR